MCTSVSTMIVTSIFRELISVFNLEISQSGAYVLHGTLNWSFQKVNGLGQTTDNANNINMQADKQSLNRSAKQHMQKYTPVFFGIT